MEKRKIGTHMQFLIDDIIKFNEKIYKLKTMNENGNLLYIMRDDLIPFSFGGNKARKARYFFKEILENGYDYVITYGSASSNHCRIIANVARKYNLKCTIISTDKEEKTNNKIMCEIFGVEFVYCDVDNVKSTIDKQVNEKKVLGYKPYFIQGGGHGNLGTQGYVDAFEEIKDFEDENNIKFDYIFHASGTGTTQAGLVVGKILNNSDVKIIGISVSRTNPRGRNVVIDSVNEYLSEHKIKNDFKSEDVIYEDKYICEGYRKYNKEIEETIIDLLQNEGIPLDTTYTGKAFWGMKEYIKENGIKNKNILFIHTGGTPIFFDFLRSKK